MKTYFIADGHGRVKIGRSHDPELRLKGLQTGAGSRLELVLVLDGDHEAKLHEAFKIWRLSGEWFQLSKQISGFIRGRESHFCLPLFEWLKTRIDSLEPALRKTARQILGKKGPARLCKLIQFHGEEHRVNVKRLYRMWRRTRREIPYQQISFSKDMRPRLSR